MFTYNALLRKKVSYNPMMETDYEDKPHTGNNAIDNQDRLRLTVPNALTQGIGTNKLAGTIGGAIGAKDFARTRRGNRASTHEQFPREVYIKFE